jgi:hypothetical protein
VSSSSRHFRWSCRPPTRPGTGTSTRPKFRRILVVAVTGTTHTRGGCRLRFPRVPEWRSASADTASFRYTLLAPERACAYAPGASQYTVHDGEDEVTEAASTTGPPLAEPVSPPSCSPLYSMDNDSDADTTARLEKAMDPYSDAPRKPSLLRRRLSTLIIVRSLTTEAALAPR